MIPKMRLESFRLSLPPSVNMEFFFFSNLIFFTVIRLFNF